MTNPLAIGGRGAVLALLIALAGVFGVAGSARASIVADLMALPDGANANVMCVTSVACTTDTGVGGGGAATAVGSEFTHEIIFSLGIPQNAEVGLTVATALPALGTTVQLFQYDSGPTAVGSDPIGINPIAAGLSDAGCVSNCTWELTAPINTGSQYFVRIIGTPVSFGVIYSANVTISAVPLPPAFLLLVTALLGLLGYKRFRTSRAAA